MDWEPWRILSKALEPDQIEYMLKRPLLEGETLNSLGIEDLQKEIIGKKVKDELCGRITKMYDLKTSLNKLIQEEAERKRYYLPQHFQDFQACERRKIDSQLEFFKEKNINIEKVAPDVYILLRDVLGGNRWVKTKSARK